MRLHLPQKPKPETSAKIRVLTEIVTYFLIFLTLWQLINERNSRRAQVDNGICAVIKAIPPGNNRIDTARIQFKCGPYIPPGIIQPGPGGSLSPNSSPSSIGLPPTLSPPFIVPTTPRSTSGITKTSPRSSATVTQTRTVTLTPPSSTHPPPTPTPTPTKPAGGINVCLLLPILCGGTL